MKHYLGIKLIQAEPMSENEFALSHGRPEVANDRMGYLVKYPDGYESWSPVGEFEKAYLPLASDEGKITLEDVRSMSAVVTADSLPDGKTTLVKRELVTGFVQYETSSCVDPKNYDPVLGADIAIKRMDTPLWFAMGFVLQWAKYGLKKVERV